MEHLRKPAVIAIVGTHNSGKTTLIERLIPLLREKGLRIGSIKHTCHEDFAIDKVGTDSYRHRKAGSETVVIASEAKTVLLKEFNGPLTLDEVLELFDSEDLVLVEGYKGSILPKIEVFQAGDGARPLADRDANVLAIFSEERISGEVPVFSDSELDALVEVIEREVSRQKWPFSERMN